MKFLVVFVLLFSRVFAVAPTFPVAPHSLTSNVLSTTNFLYKMDPFGNVVVVWLISFPLTVIRNGVLFQDSITVVQAAYKPFGANWILPPDPRLQRPNPPVPSPVGTLSDVNSRVIAYNLEMDELGNAVVVWLIQSRIDERVIAVQTAYKPVGGNWQLPDDPLVDNLAPNSNFVTVNTLPDIAIAGGNVVIGWSINAGITGQPVAQAGFKPAAAFTPASSSVYGAVDVGYNIRILSDPNLIGINAYPRVTPNGFLPKVVINNTIPDLSVPTLTPQVAVDTLGNAVIAWQCSENTFSLPILDIPNSFVQAIYKPAAAATFDPNNIANLSNLVPVTENVVSAATSPPTQVSQYQGQPPPIVSPPPQVSIHSGNAVVIWAETNGVHNFLQAAYNLGGVGWQVPMQGI